MSPFDVKFVRDGVIVHYSLTKVLPDGDYPARQFHGHQLLHYDYSMVYRGVISQEGLRDKDAVCKIARRDLSRIRHEAKLYDDPDRLGGLQGKYVPRCYGYFEGFTRSKAGQNVEIGCLVLEYCGERLTSESPLIHEDSIR